MTIAGEVIKRGASAKGFECTIVRERTPGTESKYHYGIYRRGLSKAQVLAGKAPSGGQGQARWTPNLDRAETIFDLYMADRTEAEFFGTAGARTPGKAS
jgi:hypothetical protein